MGTKVSSRQRILHFRRLVVNVLNRVGQLRGEESRIVRRKQNSSFVARKLRNQTTRYTRREYITEGRNITPNTTAADIRHQT